MRMFILLVALLLCTGCCTLGAESAKKEPPAESVAALQGVFSRVAELLWERSDELFHEGYHLQSAALLRLITEIDPTDVEAFAVGSWLLDSNEKRDEALAFLERGLKLNPNRYEIYAELGHFHYRLKDYAKAAGYFARAVEFKDCPVVLRHILAHSYEKSGDLKKSLETWEETAKLEPDEPVVKMNLQRVKEKLSNAEGTGSP